MITRESRRNPVEMLAEDFARRLRAGERPTVSEYTESYPAYADEIGSLFPIIAALEGTKLRGSSEGDTNGSDASSAALTVFGDYCIVREIGRGGMGVVYEATQRSLDRRVALKVLPANYLPARKHVLRFQREARSAARLHHTNIAPVFGVGEQDGSYYYVMQFIDGPGMDAVIRELRELVAHPKTEEDAVPAVRPTDGQSGAVSAASIAALLVSSRFTAEPGHASQQNTDPWSGGSRPSAASLLSGHGDSPLRFSGFFVRSTGIRAESYYWRNVAGIGIQLANALQHAHDQGVLHRDVKPSNLMIGADGIAWVTDFGLAKLLDHDDITESHNTVGTLRYMAPEQLRGQSDARSDLYSLGLTLYELVTLQPAFAETDRARLVQRITRESPQRPRAVNRRIPRDLETIILKAIASEPHRRYQSASELAADLHRFMAGEAIHARATTLVRKLWRYCDRNPAIARLTTAVLILLLTVAAVGSIGYIRTTSALVQAAVDRENTHAAWQEADRARLEAMEESANAWRRVEELERRLRELESAAAERD